MAAAVFAVVAAFLVLAPPVERPVLRGEAAEVLLQTADVVSREPLATGVTRSSWLTLRRGEQEARAVWKTIDEHAHFQRFETGLPEVGFRDTWKHEVAAYELDKVLGLGVVPPTVQRKIRRESGALQLWIEGAMTEAERLRRGLEPPDSERWNRQTHEVRLLRHLTYDTDYRNVGNLLVDPEFHLWAIDHSRAFRRRQELLPAMPLERFSRRVLLELRALTPELLGERLGRWLTREQILSLLARRDRIVAEADRLVAARGEERVLF